MQELIYFSLTNANFYLANRFYWAALSVRGIVMHLYQPSVLLGVAEKQAHKTAIKLSAIW